MTVDRFHPRLFSQARFTFLLGRQLELLLLKRDFDIGSRTTLENISQETYTSFIVSLVPVYLLHILLVCGLHAFTVVPAFKNSSFLQKIKHLTSTLFMVIPFRTTRAEDARKAMKQEVFQLLLHTSGNLAMLLASRYCLLHLVHVHLVHLEPLQGHLSSSVFYGYFLLPVLLCNVLAGCLLFLYHTR